MKQDDLICLSFEFLTLLIARVGAKKIRRVILFGSVARGDFDKDSDIDVFVDIFRGPSRDSETEVSASVHACVNSFDAVRKKRWDIRGITLPVKVTVGDLEQYHWKPLVEEMQDHGIVLFGPFAKAGEKIHTLHLLVTFAARGLSPARRMQLARRIFGYSIKKEGKTYPQQGLVEQEAGLRLGPGAFIVPLAAKRSVESLFREIPVKYQIRKMTI